MSLSDEIQRLDDLRRSGVITQAEFETAKRKVLGESDACLSDGGSVSEQLKDLKQQNEVAQLDREWDLERESYMVRGKHGYRYIPSRAGSIVGGVLFGAFGCLWLSTAAAMPAGGPFSFVPLIGILIILFGIGMSFVSFAKAGAYQEAESRYQRRRSELLGRQPRD